MMTKLELVTLGAMLLATASANPMTMTKRAATKLNPTEIQQVLDAHNAYRTACGVPKLTWSDEAASAAQNWVGTCPGGNGLKHGGQDVGGKHFGQNIAIQKGYKDLTGMVMDQWCKSEIDDFKRNPNGYSHFTQVVWKSTTQVGCGFQVCNGWNAMICDYLPAGNNPSQNAANVFLPKGTPARPPSSGPYKGDGGNQGGNQGGDQSSNQGGDQSGSQGGSQTGNQGGNQWGNQGGSQGGFQGGSDNFEPQPPSSGSDDNGGQPWWWFNKHHGGSKHGNKSNDLPQGGQQQSPTTIAGGSQYNKNAHKNTASIPSTPKYPQNNAGQYANKSGNGKQGSGASPTKDCDKSGKTQH